MVSRPREVLEAELAHVNFLLNELGQWDPSVIPVGVRRYVFERYQRRQQRSARALGRRRVVAWLTHTARR